MIWVKVWHGQKNGMRTIRYTAEDSRFEIESRRRRIPHANGEGYWYHTTYYVVDTATGYERECWRLKDAKKTAEELIRGMSLADPKEELTQ